MKKQLHPGAKWIFRIGFYFVALILTLFLSVAWISKQMQGILFVLISLDLFIIALAEIYARFAYANWFYEFTEHQLRLERGIIWKRYSNIPYERVQNIDITRGIIARTLGFSTVLIQTAGFSHVPNANMKAEGYIPAVSVEEAEHIREFVVKKVSKNGRKQGL